jgi:MFS family permease
MGDRYGQRPLFAPGLVASICGSATCGLAHNPAEQIGARTLQGIGGALLSPQCLAILQVLFQGESRASAISLYTGLSMLSVPMTVLAMNAFGANRFGGAHWLQVDPRTWPGLHWRWYRHHWALRRHFSRMADTCAWSGDLRRGPRPDLRPVYHGGRAAHSS